VNGRPLGSPPFFATVRGLAFFEGRERPLRKEAPVIEMRTNQFSHERLEAYRVALEFLGVAQAILDEMPRAGSTLREQLASAAESVLLNCAEGAGRRSARDRARHFDIARGSAEECAAILDALAVRRLASGVRAGAGRALLLREVRLLSGLARSALRREA
jgi:four helix bundle protein